MNDVGGKLLASIVDNEDKAFLVNHVLRDDMFVGNEEQWFGVIMEHIKLYGHIPKRETLAEKGMLLPAAIEPTQFYYDQTIDRHRHRTIVASMEEANGLLAKQKSLDALELINTRLTELSMLHNQKSLMDFRDCMPMFHQFIDSSFKGKKGIPIPWPYLEEMAGGLWPGDFVPIVGRPQQGKELPDGTQVKTLEGWVSIEDCRVGDWLASPDGTPSQVTGVFPQGEKKTYTLTFQDGRRIRAGGEHLWEVKYRDWEECRLKTTEELIVMLKAKRYQKRLSIRLCTGEFGKDTCGVSVDPWLLGFLLGDGCFRGTELTFTSADSFLVEKIRQLLPSCEIVFRGDCTYAVRGGYKSLVPTLKRWGLWGCKSETKFIPQQYLLASRESRVQLLQGLMDADGSVSRSRVEISLSNSRLAEQFVDLVRSLGGIAVAKPRETTHQISYRIGIRYRNQKELFSLPRKKDRCKEDYTYNKQEVELRLTLLTIEQDPDASPCTCISVSHPEGLFITENYIVTHNSWLVLYWAWQCWLLGYKPLVVSMEMKPILIIKRLVAMAKSLNMDHVKHGQLDDVEMKEVFELQHFLQEAPTPFHILDGELVTSSLDIIQHAALLQPDIVLIDGGYLVNHTNKKLGKYERVGETARDFKTGATVMDNPWVVSYQFNRQAAKGKDKKGGLEDIGYSDEIAQLASIALALQQKDMAANIHKKMVDVLKGRSGETGHWWINWDFVKTDFSQTVKESTTGFMK